MRGAARAPGLSAARAALVLAALAAGALAGAQPAHAARPPVVMLVLDEFPVDSLLTADGRIDARRYPGFARLASVSTWFPNAQSVYDSTERAVPALLSGMAPDRSAAPTWRDSPQTVFTYLDRLGYAIRAREEATAMCPPRLCPRTVGYGRPRQNLFRGRLARLEHTIAGIGRRGRRPVFTFHHSLVPHVPWTYLPSGRHRVPVKGARNLPDFGVPEGFGDRFLTLHNEQRYLLQLGFVDREIGRLLRRMRRERVLRRSLLVVAADHGLSFQVGVDDRRSVTRANVHEIAPVPLFVKRPGQRRGTVNRAYARTTDILPTIASLLGRPLLRPVSGRSAFAAVVARRPGVRIVSRDFSHIIRVPAAKMQRRRAAAVSERVARFGAGPWGLVFHIGPHQDLLGRRADRFSVASGGPASAGFAVPASTIYKRSSLQAPVWVAGSLRGRRPKTRRDLALAVNGRVRAVGASIRLRGDRTEWFSLTVPEAALRAGHNRFALYEVSGEGEDLRLRPLGERR